MPPKIATSLGGSRPQVIQSDARFFLHYRMSWEMPPKIATSLGGSQPIQSDARFFLHYRMSWEMLPKIATSLGGSQPQLIQSDARFFLHFRMSWEMRPKIATPREIPVPANTRGAYPTPQGVPNSCKLNLWQCSKEQLGELGSIGRLNAPAAEHQLIEIVRTT